MSGRRRVGSSGGNSHAIVSSGTPATSERIPASSLIVNSSGVTQIYDALRDRISLGEAYDSLDKIADVAEASRLASVAVDR